MSDRDLKIRVLLDTVERITRPLRDVVGGAGAAGRAMKAAREEVRRLEKAGRDLSTLKQLRTQAEVGRATLDRYAAKLADIEARTRAASGPTRALSAELRRVSGEARSAAEALATDSRRLDELETRLRGAGHDVNDLAGSERKLTTQLTAANRALETQARRMGRIREARERAGRMKEMSGQAAAAGAGLLGAGVGLAAPIVLASKAAMGFEEHMADVRKVVNFPSPKSFGDFRAGILGLSGELPLTADQLGDIAAEAARAGVPLADLLKHTRTAAKMQIAFDLRGDPAQAGAILAAWRNAFGFEEEGIQHLGDQINALTNKWGGHADAVAEVVTRVGPLAKVSGLGAGQTAALASVLASMNVNSDVAATGIKNLMLRLGAGEAATTAQRKAFKALGLDAVQMAKLMTTDASGAIVMMMDKLHGLEKFRQNAVLTELVGRESIEPIGMLAGRLGRVRDALKLVEDQKAVGGSMDAEYAARASTTANALRLLKNNATAVGVEIGYTLLPIIKATTEFLSKAAGGVRNFAQAHPGLVRVIAIVAAVMGGLLAVLGAVGIVIGAVLVPLAALSAAAIALDIGLLPLILIIVAVVAAVGLLAAGAVWVVSNWKGIAGFFGRIWETVRSTTVGALSAIGRFLMDWTPLGFVVRLGAMLARGIGQALQVARTTLGQLAPVIAGALRTAATAFLRFTPAGWMLQALSAAVQIVRTFGPRFMEAGAHLISGLVRGLLGGLDQVRKVLRTVGDHLINGLKARLGIHSPSRVFAQLGIHTMAGLGVGLRRGEGDPLAAITATARKAAAALSIAATAGAGAPALAMPALAVSQPITRAARLAESTPALAPARSALAAPGPTAPARVMAEPIARAARLAESTPALARVRPALAAPALAAPARTMAEPIARAALRADGTPALARARPAALRPPTATTGASRGGDTFVFSPTVQGASMSEAELMRLFQRWTRDQKRQRDAAGDARLSDSYEGGGL